MIGQPSAPWAQYARYNRLANEALNQTRSMAEPAASPPQNP